eukprot:TRINITY_DN17753_c0_g1_i6.p1 TRINITY_DN17753_c0_g1~~TRINITY_DN17753_c0_g1_i6.p1  ORF type:complete len:786 (+),score=94.89 TRINITY_DN17753_c0_g1_i6:52-2409(+)
MLRHFYLALTLICLLDLSGFIPHGRTRCGPDGRLVHDPLYEKQFYTFVTSLDDLGNNGVPRSCGSGCRPHPSQDPYTIVQLCGTAAKVFSSRVAFRSSRSALVHFLLWAWDLWRFGGASLQSIFSNTKYRLTVEDGGPPSSQRVLEAMVAPAGPLPMPVAGEDTTEGTSCSLASRSTVLETLCCYLLLLPIIWLTVGRSRRDPRERIFSEGDPQRIGKFDVRSRALMRPVGHDEDVDSLSCRSRDLVAPAEHALSNAGRKTGIGSRLKRSLCPAKSAKPDNVQPTAAPDGRTLVPGSARNLHGPMGAPGESCAATASDVDHGILAGSLVKRASALPSLKKVAQRRLRRQRLSALRDKRLAGRREIQRRDLTKFASPAGVQAFAFWALPEEATEARICFGWDVAQVQQGVEIHTAAVAFDTSGHDKLCSVHAGLSSNSGMKHSGGKLRCKAEDDEEIVVNFKNLPKSTSQIYFCVNIASSDGFSDCTVLSHVHLRILCNSSNREREVGSYQINGDCPEGYDAAGIIMARLCKIDSGWIVQNLGKFCFGARWDECVSDMLRLRAVDMNMFDPKTTEAFASGAMKSQAGMTKLCKSYKKVLVGLGWDISGDASVDLDVSAVVYDDVGLDSKGAVFFHAPSMPGIRHSGDNLEGGEGEEDDETITVCFDELDPAICHIFFVVNVFTKEKTFRELRRTFCRIVDLDDGNRELVRFDLNDMSKTNGLVFARFFRDAERSWHFQNIGHFCNGRTYFDLKPEILKLRALLPDYTFEKDMSGNQAPIVKRSRAA